MRDCAPASTLLAKHQWQSLDDQPQAGDASDGRSRIEFDDETVPFPDGGERTEKFSGQHGAKRMR